MAAKSGKKSKYSESELAQLSKPELIQVVVRQAEKYNRQISRAKKSTKQHPTPLDLSSVGGDKRLKRDPGYYSGMTEAELAKHYLETETRFGHGATKKGIEQNKAELESDLRKIFGLVGEEFDDAWKRLKKGVISKKTIFKLRKTIADIKASAKKGITKLWYNDTKSLVYAGNIKSFARKDIEGTEADYRTLGINKYLQELSDRMPEFEKLVEQMQKKKK